MGEPASLLLLPIETRLEGLALGELRTQPRAWRRLDLDVRNADQLAKSLQEVTRDRVGQRRAGPRPRLLGRREPGRQPASGSRAPFVSIIIPHYNDLEALKRCLAGLRQQTWPGDQMEIIVADNNSSCGLDAISAAAVGARVVHAAIQGAGPARNAGVAASRGNVLAFIDSDCEPAADWVAEGVRALADFDFAGGHVQTVPADVAAITPVEAWEMVFGFDFERYIRRDGYTGSGNMWVWRDVFAAVGGFRTGVSEDMEWSFRARQAGYRLGYRPTARVSHFARRDRRDLQHRWRRVILEHYLLTRESRFGRLRWFVWASGMPFSILPHLARIVLCGRLPDLRTQASAASVLVWHRIWRMSVMLKLALTSPAPTPV